MTFDYSNIAETAVAQINDKGRDVQLVYHTEGTLNIDTDIISGDSDLTVTVRALITNFNRRDIAGGLVEVGDMRVVIAASGIAKPKTNDIIVDNGINFIIINVTEIKPGQVAILYNLEVRKG